VNKRKAPLLGPEILKQELSTHFTITITVMQEDILEHRRREEQREHQFIWAL
jgi:hypothetical protein